MTMQEMRDRLPSGIAALVLTAGLACSGCAVGRAADSQVSLSRTAPDAVAAPAVTAPFAPRTPIPPTVAAWGRSRRGDGERSAAATASAVLPEVSATAALPERFSPPQLDVAFGGQAPRSQPDFPRQAALPSVQPVRVDSAPVEDLVRPSVLHASTATFEQHVLRAEQPVLVDFYADWCGPCKAIAPVLQEVAQESPQARVVKVNIDDSPELAARFGIESVPSLLVFKQGRVVVRQTGAKNKAQLKAMLGG